MPDAGQLLFAIIAALVIVLPFVWFMYRLKRRDPDAYRSVNSASRKLEALFRFFSGG